MGKEPDDILEAYEAAENSGLEPDTVDVPLPDIEDDLEKNQPPKGLDSMDADDLMQAVMRRGSVMFSEGRMLTKCSGYDQPAICGMYPLPHPSTGDPIMVCTGPVVTEETKFKLLDANQKYLTTKTPAYNCPYHPERINQRPEEIGLNDSGVDGWL